MQFCAKQGDIDVDDEVDIDGVHPMRVRARDAADVEEAGAHQQGQTVADGRVASHRSEEESHLPSIVSSSANSSKYVLTSPPASQNLRIASAMIEPAAMHPQL